MHWDSKKKHGQVKEPQVVIDADKENIIAQHLHDMVAFSRKTAFVKSNFFKRIAAQLADAE